jgi:GNAT superfamily N-acetyltransferase
MELYLVLKNELKDFYVKFLNFYKTYNLPYMIIEVKTNNDYIEEKNELGGVISFCEFKLLGRYWYYSKDGKLWDEIQYKNWKDGFKNCVDGGWCNDNLNLYYNEKGFKVFKTYNDALIYLEDLYVQPKFRGNGIGKQFLAILAKKCIDEGLGRLEWECLTWNEPSLEFYYKLGAKNRDEFFHLRLDGKELENLANFIKD